MTIARALVVDLTGQVLTFSITRVGDGLKLDSAAGASTHVEDAYLHNAPLAGCTYGPRYRISRGAVYYLITEQSSQCRK